MTCGTLSRGRRKHGGLFDLGIWQGHWALAISAEFGHDFAHA